MRAPPVAIVVTASSPPPTPREAAWQAWFDGSACPNPGRLGLGVLLIGPDGRHGEYSEIAPGQGCNNEAELLALEMALRLAREHGARHLVLRSDSDFVVRHVGGEARTEAPRLQTRLRQVRQLMAGFASCQLSWVPRHRNRAADRLSRAALGLPDKPALHPGVLRRRRRA